MPRWFLCSLFLAILALTHAPIQAQDDDVAEPAVSVPEELADDQAEPEGAPVLDDEALQAVLEIEADEFDDQVFGGPGAAAVLARQSRLQNRLERELQKYLWPCALTELQLGKIRLAGRGDLKRTFDRVARLRAVFQKSAGEKVDLETYMQVKHSLQQAVELLDGNPFGNDSLFFKTLQTSLSPEQRTRFEVYQEIRQLGGSLASRTVETGELREIDLSTTRLKETMIPRLSRLDDVQFLNLDSCHMTDNALKSLEMLAELNGLELGSTEISDAGLAFLAPLQRLQTLNLRSTSITDAGLRHLTRLPSLRRLRLSMTPITDAGLAELQKLPNLEALALGGTDISDAGLAFLAPLQTLKELELLMTNMSDAGLEHLAGLTELKILDLRTTDITDAGVVHLARLKSLTELYLADTAVTDEGAAELKARRPNVTVYR